MIAFGTSHHLEVYKDLNYIKDLWNNLLPHGHLLKAHHLLPYQEAALAGLEPYYVVIFENQQAVACIYLQTFDFNNSHYDHSLFEKNIVLKFLKPQLLPISGKLLICGNLFRIQSPFYTATEKIGHADLPALLNTFINYTDQTFESTFIKDSDETLVKTRHACNLIFRPLEDDLIMQMPIKEHWQTLDDYAADLSKKYRKRFEKLRKSKSKINEKWLTGDEIDEFSDTLYHLYHAVSSRQPVRIGHVNAAYFKKMKLHYAENFKVLAYYFESKMVGFASFIFYEDRTFEIHYVGFEEEDNRAFDIYLNILFDGLKVGIENRQTLMELGRTARLAKASLGAIPKKMNSYFSIHWGKAAILLGVVQYYFGEKMGNEWQIRNPFKS